MQTRLLERFLRYVAVTSQSDASQAVNILFLQVNFRLIYQPEAVNKFRRLVLLLI